MQGRAQVGGGGLSAPPWAGDFWNFSGIFPQNHYIFSKL